jgi:hypothetical protein
MKDKLSESKFEDFYHKYSLLDCVRLLTEGEIYKPCLQQASFGLLRGVFLISKSETLNRQNQDSLDFKRLKG